MASQITSLAIVYSTVIQAHQRKLQSSASLAFVLGIHRWPVNSPHKGPVTRKMFPFDDVIMVCVLGSVSTSFEVNSIWLRQVYHTQMMTSYHGKSFHAIGPLWGNPPSPDGIPSQKASNMGFCVLFDVSLTKGWANSRIAREFRRHCTRVTWI